MPKKKTAPEQKAATQAGILQKAAKAIGSAVGTLAVTTGIVHGEEAPKKAVKAGVKKRAKSVAAKKKPAVKRQPPQT